MKSIQTKIMTLVCVCIALVLTGCNWGNGNDAQLTEDEAIAAKLGNVSTIYYSAARYAEDQIIPDFRGYKQVRFHSILVEYHDIFSVYDDYIVSYAKRLEGNNALMHHSYAGQTYKADKTYVEIATYTDVATNKPVAREIRVFNGNFMEEYENNFWYAKSVLVSPLLQVDLEKGLYIATGTPVKADDPFGKTLNDGYAISLREDWMSILGEVSNVYAETDDDGNLKEYVFTNKAGEQVRSCSLLIEYKSLTDGTKQSFAGKDKDSYVMGSSVLKFDDREYISCTNFVGDDWESYSLRLYDKSTSSGYNAVDLSPSSEDDLAAIANGTYRGN